MEEKSVPNWRDERWTSQINHAVSQLRTTSNANQENQGVNKCLFELEQSMYSLFRNIYDYGLHTISKVSHHLAE